MYLLKFFLYWFLHGVVATMVGGVLGLAVFEIVSHLFPGDTLHAAKSIVASITGLWVLILGPAFAFKTASLRATVADDSSEAFAMAIDDIRLKLSFLPLIGSWFVRANDGADS
jgi:hypothetical protein